MKLNFTSDVRFAGTANLVTPLGKPGHAGTFHLTKDGVIMQRCNMSGQSHLAENLQLARG